jgi:hypothetical protein
MSLVVGLLRLLHRAKSGQCIKQGVRVEGSRRQLPLAVAGSGSQPAQKRLPHWLNTLDSYPHLYPKHSH